MPTNANLRIHNLDVVLRRIQSIGGGAPKYMAEVLSRAMHDDVWPKWIEHISLDDHSLEDLARLGHPYSVRMPADNLHPDSEVHKQGGSLFEGSSIAETTDGMNPAIELVNTSPHYKFLRYGTRYMRIRDPGGAALAESLDAIRKRFKDEVKIAIVQILVS